MSFQVDWLAEKLKEANFTVSSMHGEMEQQERDTIMKEFRGGDRLVFNAEVNMVLVFLYLSFFTKYLKPEDIGKFCNFHV